MLYKILCIFFIQIIIVITQLSKITMNNNPYKQDQFPARDL